MRQITLTESVRKTASVIGHRGNHQSRDVTLPQCSSGTADVSDDALLACQVVETDTKISLAKHKHQHSQ